MLSIFERSVLRTYLYVNGVCLTAIVGLFVIIDLFDNADDFFHSGRSYLAVLINMAEYYGHMALFVFDSTCTVLLGVSLIVVLLMLQRKQQLRPLLASGVPTYRILAPPILVGTLIMIGLKTANRELILDRRVHQLHEQRGSEKATAHAIEPMYDHQSLILVDGRMIFPKESRMEDATFVLPHSTVAVEMTTIQAPVAFCGFSKQHQANGWLLKESSTPFSQIPLTSSGVSFVKPGTTDREVFIVTDIGPDLLYKGKQNSSYLATATLLRRIQSSVLDTESLRKLEYVLHSRFVEPVLNLAMVFLVIPLMIRKDSRGLVMNVLIAGVLFFSVYISTMACEFLAEFGAMSIPFAVCLPVLVCGTMASWSAAMVET